MATKSKTQTAYTQTLSSASSYSSGPLDVSDFSELCFMVTVSAVSDPSNTYLNIGIVDDFGAVHNVSSIPCNATSPLPVHSLGAGVTDASSGANSAFGSQVQLDLQIPAANTLSATIAIQGK